MKKGIHPELFEITVRCVCGHEMKTSSTKQDIRATLCSACHPFYTGTSRFVDSARRIDKFNKKFDKKTQA